MNIQDVPYRTCRKCPYAEWIYNTVACHKGKGEKSECYYSLEEIEQIEMQELAKGN